MKKLLVCLVVLACLLVPAIAMAEEVGTDWWWPWPPKPKPCPTTGEVETWELVKETETRYEWKHFYPGGTTGALARCWKNNDLTGDNCNKKVRTAEFQTNASVAQWCDWSISSSRWDWHVLKPGTYAADCVTLKVKSNGSVNVSFAGLKDLARPTESDPDPHHEESLHEIPTYYAVVPGANAGIQDTRGRWVRAGSETNVSLEDSLALHAGLEFKLFNRIEVANCNSVGEYSNSGVISLVLTNIKSWVDGDAGGWAANQF